MVYLNKILTLTIPIAILFGWEYPFRILDMLCNTYYSHYISLVMVHSSRNYAPVNDFEFPILLLGIDGLFVYFTYAELQLLP